MFAGDDPINAADPTGRFRVYVNGILVPGTSDASVWNAIEGGSDVDNILDAAGIDPGSVGDGIRGLTTSEQASLGNICQFVNCDKVRLHVPGGSNSANVDRQAWLALCFGCIGLTTGYDIYFNATGVDGDGGISTPLLAHELTHVSQYQQWGDDWRASILTEEISGFLTGRNLYNVNNLAPGDGFAQLGWEQQGQIVENCFRGTGSCRLSPFHP